MRIIITLIIFACILIAIRTLARRRGGVVILDKIAPLLEDQVDFYRQLDEPGKKKFSERVSDFISRTNINGIGIKVTDSDKVLVAASAIIPIYHFPEWRYRNINEVLLYQGTFNKEYQTEGEDRNVLGMVGDGAMNGQMILSQPALRQGFAGNDGHNTAIHEFVHLLDKADGSVDGIPEYLLAKPYIIPWVKRMHEEISKMRQHSTDIDAYGATNDAEFFAVISEYFFEKPGALREHHPELYKLLELMFTGEPSRL